MANSEKILDVYSHPSSTEYTDHSGDPNWLWIETLDFEIYLLENKYICQYSVASLPHDESHGLCARCQVKEIGTNIRKRIKIMVD